MDESSGMILYSKKLVPPLPPTKGHFLLNKISIYTGRISKNTLVIVCRRFVVSSSTVNVDLHDTNTCSQD